MTRRWGEWSLVRVLCVALLSGCSGAGSCAGGGIAPQPYPDPPPPGGEQVAKAIQARVMERALNLVSEQAPTLLSSLFTIDGDRLVYALDETLLDPTGPVIIRDGCIGEPLASGACTPRAPTSPEELGPSYPSSIALSSLGLQNAINLSFLPPDASGDAGLRLSIENFQVFVDVALVTNVAVLGSAACHIQDAASEAAFVVGELAADFRFGQDSSGLSSRVENIVVNLGAAGEANAVNLAVTPCDGVTDPTCNDPRCHGAYGTFPETDCSEVCGLIDLFAQLGGFVTEIFNPMLEALAPSLADTLSQTLNDLVADVPVEVALAIQPSVLSQELWPHVDQLAAGATLEALDVLGDGPGRGLEVSAAVGVASSPNPCVPAFPPPEGAAASSLDLGGFVEVAQGSESIFVPYHAALSLTQPALQRILWNAYQSGLLCIDADSYAIESLTGGSFQLSAGLLADFGLDLSRYAPPNAPLLVSVRPTSVPTMTLGASKLVGEVYEPLLGVQMGNLWIDVYVFIDEGYFLITQLAADIAVGLDVLSETGSLVLAVDNVDIVDVQERVPSELLPEADFVGLIELVTELATDLLLSDMNFEIGTLDVLGDALGIPLSVRINRIRRDIDASGVSHLSAYASICNDTQLADPDTPWCFAGPGSTSTSSALFSARLLGDDMYRVPTEHERQNFERMPTGEVTLEILPQTVGGWPLEAKVRIDGGSWSSYRPVDDTRLQIDSGKLRVTGEHRIEVVARARGGVQTVGTETLSVLIDGERPKLWVQHQEDGLVVGTSDRGSPYDVEVWVRPSGEPSSPWRLEGTHISYDLLPTQGAQIIARDASGNHSLPYVVAAIPSKIATTSDHQGGCSQTTRSWAWLSLLFLALFIRRRYPSGKGPNEIP